MPKLSAIRYPSVDVAELRHSLGLSQIEFAGRFGFTLDSIRKWESGVSAPYKTARTLLGIIARDPAIVDDVLRPPRPKADASWRPFPGA